MRPRITHVIVRDNSRFVVFRAMPEVSKSFQLRAAVSLLAAQQLCECDFDWVKLCAPGKEQEQLRAWDVLHTGHPTMLELAGDKE